MKFSIKDFFRKCDQIRSNGKIFVQWTLKELKGNNKAWILARTSTNLWQKIELCLTKAGSQRTQLSSVKLKKFL